MVAAVDMQHHPGQRLTRSLFAMFGSRSRFLDQPRSLQHIFHPCVAEMDAMLLDQLLVEMQNVEIVISVPVQTHYLIHLFRLNLSPIPLSFASVEKHSHALLLVLRLPSPHCSYTDP